MMTKSLLTLALTVSLSFTYMVPAFTETITPGPGQPDTWTVSETKSAEELLLEQQALAQQQAWEAQQALLQQALELQAAQQAALLEQQQHQIEIGNFFKDSVLVGDSVALGFSNYAAKHSSLPIFQNLQFLTAGSFSVHNAFSAISSKSKHPMYRGQQRYIWDSINMMGAKHAYTFFGLNDLYAGVENTAAKYLQLLMQIKAVNPDIDYTIISTTPMYRGSEKKGLNNANIRALNASMAQIAAENGWGFIDVASLLTDSDGCLAKQYCSDSYVHETNAAYVIWQTALEKYAEDRLEAEKSDEAVAESASEEVTQSSEVQQDVSQYGPGFIQG